jgi:hypothetical protein
MAFCSMVLLYHGVVVACTAQQSMGIHSVRRKAACTGIVKHASLLRQPDEGNRWLNPGHGLLDEDVASIAAMPVVAS